MKKFERRDSSWLIGKARLTNGINKESFKNFLIEFHVKFSSFVEANPPALTLYTENPFALACYWAFVYFGLIATSAIDRDQRVGEEDEYRKNKRKRRSVRFPIKVIS